MLKTANHRRTDSKIRLNREVVRVLRPDAFRAVVGGSYESNGACTSNNCTDACTGSGHTIQ